MEKLANEGQHLLLVKTKGTLQQCVKRDNAVMYLSALTHWAAWLWPMRSFHSLVPAFCLVGI